MRRGREVQRTTALYNILNGIECFDFCREDRVYDYETLRHFAFPMISFTVFLKRSPQFFLMNVIIPCTIMTALSILVFGLPAESGEKISLEMTIMLSFSVMLLMVSDTTPRTSTTTPIIGTWSTNNNSLILPSLSILFYSTVI